MERRLILKHTGPCVEHFAMPRNASLVPERSHVVAFSRWAGNQIQDRWSTIAVRPLVVVMTYARCKPTSGLRMAGFRKFRGSSAEVPQTSCIAHKIYMAVEVCTPTMPLPTKFADDQHDLGFPSAAPLFHLICFQFFYRLNAFVIQT